jgi:hypothetical protein
MPGPGQRRIRPLATGSEHGLQEKGAIMKKWLVNKSLATAMLAGSMLCLVSAAAGNQVVATLEGSLITIRGDQAANQITVTQNLLGDVFVTGKFGTLVNGLPQVRFNRVALNAMEIRMEGGNDVVTISRLNVANDLYINLGAGADRLQTGAYPSSIGANLSIEGGSGIEVVRLTGWTVDGDLFLDGQADSLTADLSGLTIGFGLTVIGDAAGDVVTLASSWVGDTTSIETKEGADRVTVTDLTGYSLAISTDVGNDQVTLDQVDTLEDVGVFTGAGNDTVTFTAVTSAKNINVSLDAGTDMFSGFGVFASFDAVFEGGAGFDTFGDFGVAGGVKTEIKEFEFFP